MLTMMSCGRTDIADIVYKVVSDDLRKQRTFQKIIFILNYTDLVVHLLWMVVLPRARRPSPDMACRVLAVSVVGKSPHTLAVSPV